MLEHIDKSALLLALRGHLEQELSQLLKAQRSTQEGATHEESRAENDKDTRALESTYLARGLSERVAQLENGLKATLGLKPRTFGADDPVALGALVAVELGPQEAFYLVAPAGAGARLNLPTHLELKSQHVQIVTTKSPLGQALLGKYVDDDFEVQTPQGRREGTITAIR